MRQPGETRFAIFTLILSVPYLIGETYTYFAHVGFGQYFLGYFVDLIAIALMLMAGIASLRHKNRSAAGWLAGTWGFLACLNYRAFAWRYYELKDNGAIGTEPGAVFTILVVALVVTFGGFLYALFLSRPQQK